MREQFIQNVAHELRTPLALVRGYVEMLSEGGLDKEEREMALDVTRRRVETLVDLVEGISTLQDISSRPLKVEQIEPFELLRTASGMIGQRSVAAGIDLKTECPADLVTFPGDFTRLAQALHQLLDNACKFSPDGGKVLLAAEATSDEMVISVTDQGIGIPPDEQDRIFERFYQIDGSMSRRFGGTGLGLALVKEVIEAHSGRVAVSSDGESGTIFSVYLPLRRADIV
jgi:two-component system sensor histidine kinase VicK